MSAVTPSPAPSPALPPVTPVTGVFIMSSYGPRDNQPNPPANRNSAATANSAASAPATGAGMDGRKPAGAGARCWMGRRGAGHVHGPRQIGPERGEFWPLAACEAQLAGYLPIAE